MALFLGAGFLGTAFLDGYHTIVTSAYFKPFMPSDNESLIPWSWLASRQFLAMFLLLSVLSWSSRKISESGHKNFEPTVYVFTAVFTLACFLFFAFVPLPPAYYPDLPFHRPEEFLPAGFFLFALIAYLQRDNWRDDILEHWMVLSIIVALVGQTVVMPFSGRLFDFEFDLAHGLKIVSYLFVLTGLLKNIVVVYNHAEKANQAKTDFMNIMSHELRTPLTILLGYTPVLLNPSKLPSVKRMYDNLDQGDMDEEDCRSSVQEILDEYTKYITKMDASGAHLLSLINCLLDLSKIEAGKLQVELEVIKLDEPIRTVMAEFKQKARCKNLELSVRTNGEAVLADPIRLKQILINLVGNAIKFTDRGGVEIRTQSKGDFVEFYVKDTGCGIEADDLADIFDRFKQVDTSAKRKASGTGLGLAITKQLIKLQGGKISLKSKFGKGSTFVFTLPAARNGGSSNG